MSLKGRTVIVTGAGSGIGRAMALAFASNGAKVVVSDIEATRAEETVSAIRRVRGRAFAVAGDVADSAYAKLLATVALEKFKGIDVLCNNAGITDNYTPVDEMSEETWRRVIDVNLTGQFLVTRAVLPHMLAAKRGVILNTSSVAGIVAIYGPAYSASKHGVIGLTQSVAATYGPDGIRCVAICPGQVPSNLSAHVRITNPRILRRRGHRQDRPPAGTPEQIAEVAVFLSSDSASYINGASIVVDNGLLVY